MELESSLPSLQEPTADHSPEPDESRLHLLILQYFQKTHFNIILPYMHRYFTRITTNDSVA
jgi:hypothetical protein